MNALYLTADAAIDRLGVSKATLYAYVSRGQIRTSTLAEDPRRRLYSSFFVEALAKRKKLGRKPSIAAATTLDWGMPVLDSGITLIEHGKLYYRGHDAARWASTATLEETACLLWQCGDSNPFLHGTQSLAVWDDWMIDASRHLPLVERCQALLPFLDKARAIAWQKDRRKLWPSAVELLRALAAAASNGKVSPAPIHRALAENWQLSEAQSEVIRQALVLLADHELNASAFAVRVVASTGASLGSCLNAGLSALNGPLHGGTTSLIERLWDELQQSGDAEQVINTRLHIGQPIPGFETHPLYPDGDPRAAALLPLLPPDAERTALIDQMAELTGRLPNVDFALVAIRRAFSLPKGSGIALFAIGRTVGWIAHALEQYGDGRLLRSRAHYNGPSPESLMQD